MKKTVSIIGSGFSSLSAACYMAKAGYVATIYEKNSTLGGRARQLKKDGFIFDMGPTWYWMPDVFDRFFGDFGKKTSDYYELEKLSPAYSVYFGKDDRLTIADNMDDICELFEQEEPGSSAHLLRFMANAEKNYGLAIEDLVYKPGESIWEITTLQTVMKLREFVSTISKDVRRHIKSKKLREILEFPVLFLGAKASNTPAFYSFMNQADFGLGTFMPKGGMYAVVDACVEMAKELGVKFVTDAAIEDIHVEHGKFRAIQVNGEYIASDYLISGADYHHTEQLLNPKYRQYKESYWKKKTYAPSALLYYVGFDTKVEGVDHHTLFFDVEFATHATDIYDTPNWPEQPLFYASFASKSDSYFAPEGKEAATFLIPIAPDLVEEPHHRKHYLDIILKRMHALTGQDLSDKVLFAESYCVDDFKQDYNSYAGNAYGLANTLFQTHILRPNLRSRKVKNLYFTGQLTVPGPGVPPALISGKLVADLLISKTNTL